MQANSCTMPEPADPTEAQVYTKIRDLIVRSHCADKRPAHKCAGTVMIDREHITLACPRCGDVRSIIK